MRIVDIYRDENHTHYTVRESGSSREQATLCGLLPSTLKKAAWFRVGDRRGMAHYSNACEQCAQGLEY